VRTASFSTFTAFSGHWRNESYGALRTDRIDTNRQADLAVFFCELMLREADGWI
jgi:hypothetical protein